MDISSISSANIAEINKFWDWMSSSGRAEIVAYDVSGNDLRSLFDYDPTDYWNTSLVTTLSDHINEFIELEDSDIERFYKTEPTDWSHHKSPAIYHTYRLFKLLWLARDIREKNVQESPVQMFKIRRGYSCHPGSDKRLVISLLEPMKTVRCFYIWYPELDPEPWHHTIEHRTIRDTQDFVDLFYRADHETFTFGTHDAIYKNGEWNMSDVHIEPFARGMGEILKKKNSGDVVLPHLSYKDGIHRAAMFEAKELVKEIYLDDSGTFHLGEFKFECINSTWIPVHFLNRPNSLIDTNWQNDNRYNLSIKL